MDASAFIPALVALLGGGSVAFYTARPKKDSIIAEASERAVAVVREALERMEDEVKGCNERCAQLEAQLGKEMFRAGRLEKRVTALSAEVTRLGGNVAAVLAEADGR